MEITITKDDFQRVMPVGISAHESLFAKIYPRIEDEIYIVTDSILGEVGREMLENDSRFFDYLRRCFKKYVCLKAFLGVLRQLDLVLTPSGFGVVSSDKYAPASKMRVDALEGSLRTETLIACGWLIDALRSAEWGKTEQAKEALPYIYNSKDFFMPRSDGSVSYQDWEKFKTSIPETEKMIRSKVGDAMVDKVMECHRCKTDNSYIGLHGKMKVVCDIAARDGIEVARHGFMDDVFRTLERDVDKFPEWRDSNEYKAYHGETYKNTEDSTAFFFC